MEKWLLLLAAVMALPHLLRMAWNSIPKDGTCIYCGKAICDEDCHADSRW